MPKAVKKFLVALGWVPMLFLFQNCSSQFSVQNAANMSAVTQPNAPAADPDPLTPVATPTSTPGQTQTSNPTPLSFPMLDVYLWDHPGYASLYQEWLGRRVVMGQSHQGKDNWSRVEGESWQLQPWADWVHAVPGRILNLSVAIFPAGMGASLGACAAGSYDSHYLALANNLVTYGLQKSILRVGWEFSGGWMPWYSGYGNVGEFADCFRRIVTVMRSATGGNFKFDWNPAADIQESEMDLTYPGDTYVDYVGVDIYDSSWFPNTYPYPAICDADCRLTRQTLAWDNYQGPNLAKFARFGKAHGKQVSVPEWGLVGPGNPNLPGGGDNPYYIRKMLEFIFDPANNVGYASYFDVESSENNIQLSDVGTNAGEGPHDHHSMAPESAALFKQIIQSKIPVGL